MLENKKDRIAWLYIVLPLFFLTVFTFYPLIKTILISFFSSYNSVADDFGGYFDLEAYKALFNDPYYRSALSNTMILVFISVPISTVLALLIAVALNSIKPLQKSFKQYSSYPM